MEGWINLSIDMFGNRKIKQLESKPNADTLIVIWLKVLTLAGRIDKNGLLMLTDKEKYTDKLLAIEFGRNDKIVAQAMKLFCSLKMVEKVNGVYAVCNWKKYQYAEAQEAIREYNAQKQRESRARKKQKCAVNDNVNDNVNDVSLTKFDSQSQEKKEKNQKKNKEIVSKYVNKNNNNTSVSVRTYACESYEEVMDGCCCTPLVKEALFNFIKHLQANGVKIINDRLTSLIVALDMSYNDDKDRVEAINEAIAKGRRQLACEQEYRC